MRCRRRRRFRTVHQYSLDRCQCGALCAIRASSFAIARPSTYKLASVLQKPCPSLQALSILAQLRLPCTRCMSELSTVRFASAGRSSARDLSVSPLEMRWRLARVRSAPLGFDRYLRIASASTATQDCMDPCSNICMRISCRWATQTNIASGMHREGYPRGVSFRGQGSGQRILSQRRS